MNLWRVRPSGWRLYAALSGAFLVLTLPILIGKTASAPGPVRHASPADDVIHVIKSTPGNTSQTNPAVKGIAVMNLQLPPAHDGLNTSSEPQLRKLAQYEESAGGAVASGMMYFTRYSDSVSAARADAADMYKTLQEFAKYNLTPLIIMEPTNSNGSLDFKNYRDGAYDGIVDAYFQKLKNLGATDSDIGIWTYFPEANLPEWGPVDTNDFAPNVTRTVNIQKKYFPNSRASIMLDAESYPNGSTNWGSGSYTSLLPFIGSIPAGTLDSFGLQGFPWAPPANQGGYASYDPSVYLKSSLAAEAAARLGTKNIWLNTGTFHAMYESNRQQTVVLSPQQRQSMLNGVIGQIKNLQNSGYTVAVNLFSEDKSNTAESIDWSYKSADDQIVLNNFALQLKSLGAELWLFDA